MSNVIRLNYTEHLAYMSNDICLKYSVVSIIYG